VTSKNPAISVVVPTYNRLPMLRRALEALERQDVDALFEVVVVSDGSTDETDAFLRGHASSVTLRPVFQPNQGPATARNRGFTDARGDLIVFVDDDVVADPGLLRVHLEAHRDNPELVTIGPMLTPPDHKMTPWVAWEQSMLYRQYSAMIDRAWHATARQFYTGNSAVRRVHLVRSGGFDTSFRRAEDVELGYRMAAQGLRFEFLPDAIGRHYAERSFDSWRQAAYAYGCHDIVFARDRGQRWLEDAIVDKLAAYPRPVEWALSAAVPRPRFVRAAGSAVGRSATFLDRIGARRSARRLLSGVYALEYFQGVHDEAGSLSLARSSV
jgi:GT2 family glycosyltransferase